MRYHVRRLWNCLRRRLHMDLAAPTRIVACDVALYCVVHSAGCCDSGSALSRFQIIGRRVATPLSVNGG